HAAARAVEAHFRGVVPDVQYNFADQRLHVHPRLGGDFARDHDHARLDEGLAGDTSTRIVAQDRIEYRVGDLVGHLVRVTFGYGLGRKQIVIRHLTHSARQGFWVG